jgi:serine/threonine protein kinase
LSKNDIIHRDFKIANVFVDEYGICKIADFGFAVKSKDQFKDISLGSPIYMSPEAILYK